MNILMLASDLDLDDEIVVMLATARSLLDRGHKIRLLAREGQMGSALLHGSPPVEPHQLTGTPWRDRLECLRLKRMLRETAPDVLHVVSGALEASGRLLARTLEIPRVVSVSGVAKDATVLVAHPRTASTGRTFHVPRGLHFGKVPRAQQSGTGGHPSVGTLGPITKERELKTYVRALAIVREEHPGAHFPVVGTGPYHRFLVRRALDAGIRDNLVICDPAAEPARILSGFDVVVFPGAPVESEVLPILSLGCDRPTLVTRASRAARIFEETVPEWLLPAGDHEAHAAAILSVLADLGAANARAAAGGEAVRARCVIGPMIEGVEAAYLSAVGALPGARALGGR